MLNPYVNRAENLYENPNAYNWINSLSFGALDNAKDKLDNQKEREDAAAQNPTTYNTLNSILWGGAETAKKAFKPEEPLSLQHIVDSGDFALKVVLLGKLIKGVNDYQKFLKSNDVEQIVNKRFYAENEEGYVAPIGGGGIADAVWSGDTRISFGHGGRHLTGTGLYIDDINKILAKDVITKNLSVGSGGSFNITINGLLFEYSAYKLSENEIKIGTFYILGKE